jgi:hypothetical protein
MSVQGSASLLAHAVHYAVLAAGAAGLGLLLLPHLAERARPSAVAPRDEHERRVRVLRASLAPAGFADVALLAPPEVMIPPASLTWVSRLALPLAVVGSTAAAGVHAAVGPAHFDDGLPIGLFFALSAAAQVSWAALVLRRPSVPVLLAGLVGNVLVLALWTATRTVGLPGGLLPGRETVGPWDLAAGGWELVTAIACLAAVLRGGFQGRVAAWAAWHPVARGWLVCSVVVLGVLSVSGAGA